MALGRTPFSSSNPYRPKRPTTDKIIFISCEGSITEEEYFNDVISFLYSNTKSSIQFISVKEDAVKTPKNIRTADQEKELSKSKPHQLLEKIEEFKVANNDKYEFNNHLEDEFWLIMDVDDHTEEYYKENWENTIELCNERNYGYAISNPFFEIWLLLHHVDVKADDHTYAVTDSHPYERTPHYRERLRYDAKAPLKDQKHIDKDHYTKEKVCKAIERARALHDANEDWPRSLGTTVYKLLEKIVEIDKQYAG